MGPWVSQAVGAVARLGVADHIGEAPASTGALAKAVGAYPENLGRTLRALATVGIFTNPSENHWGLTPVGECLKTDAPGSMRYMAIAETDDAHWRTWARFSEAVKSGKPQAEAALGCPPWEYYAKHPEDGAAFSKAMANISSMSIGPVLATYDFSGAKTVADIGGAYGALLAAVLRQQSDAKGILFDLPNIVEGAAEILGDVTDRVERIGGSFFEQAMPAADTYLLKHILHDWDDAHCKTILENIKAGMPEGAKLLIVEMVVPDEIAPGPAPWMDLNMMVLLAGKERTAAQYEALLRSAGMKTSRVIQTPSPYAIVEAVVA